MKDLLSMLTKEKTKEIIYDYFHANLLVCATNFYADKFFRISREEADFHYNIGFSPRMERKLTMSLHMSHGLAFCKIFYMQIGSILEASYFLLQEHISENHCLHKFFQKKYKAEIWKNISEDKKISEEIKCLKYFDLACLAASSANIFKHNNGTLKKNHQGSYEQSSKHLVDLMNKKLSKDDTSRFKSFLEGFEDEHLQLLYTQGEISFDGIALNNHPHITCSLYLLINNIINLGDDELQEPDSIEEAFAHLNNFEMHPLAEEALIKIGKETGTFILQEPT